MYCPSCNATDTKVIDSRLLLEENSVRRRRKCDVCETRFTTYESVQIQMPQIVKKDGRREVYNRDKILKAITKACQKQGVSTDSINKFILTIEKKLLEISSTEVNTRDLGEIIMNELMKFNRVAYVRYASFYWNFTEVDDFVFGLQNKLHSLKSISEKGEKSDYQQ